VLPIDIDMSVLCSERAALDVVVVVVCGWATLVRDLRSLRTVRLRSLSESRWHRPGLDAMVFTTSRSQVV
jgi:hypothetical protein